MPLVRFSALLGFVLMMALIPARSYAQTPAGQQPSIVATGTGSASESAQTATLQFLLGSAGAFGMTGMMMETVEIATGTPVAVGPGMMDPFGQLTDESLAAVVQALVAAGAAEEAIEVTVPATTSFMGPGGPEIGEIVVVVDRPEATLLDAIVGAVQDAAPAAGLATVHIGASYEPADCAALTRTARDAAIADARQRAEGLATSLGVTLGALIQASEMPFYGAVESVSCAPAGTEAYFGPYAPGTLAAFDARSIEAKVMIQVSLTYAVSAGA